MPRKRRLARLQIFHGKGLVKGRDLFWGDGSVPEQSGIGMDPSFGYTKAPLVGGVVGQGGSVRVLEPKAGSSGDAADAASLQARADRANFSDAVCQGGALPVVGPGDQGRWRGDLSRYMQIRIRIEPVYHPELGAHFPKLAKALEELGISQDQGSTTLYHLIRELERALYREIRPALRRAIERHRPKLLFLQGAVEERLAMWQREGLDELLYRIEDVFSDLERDLD